MKYLKTTSYCQTSNIAYMFESALVTLIRIADTLPWTESEYVETTSSPPVPSRRRQSIAGVAVGIISTFGPIIHRRLNEVKIFSRLKIFSSKLLSCWLFTQLKATENRSSGLLLKLERLLSPPEVNIKSYSFSWESETIIFFFIIFLHPESYLFSLSTICFLAV